LECIENQQFVLYGTGLAGEREAVIKGGEGEIIKFLV
jgi:hypothetical protein